MSGKEIWADIPGHPGYQASTLGRVRSLDRIVRAVRKGGKTVDVAWPGRVLKATRFKSGYVSVALGSKGKDYVHRLVLIAFVGECPPGLECAHDDGNRGNNRLDNLAWKTRSANSLDRRRHGTALFGDRNPSWAGETCCNGHAFTPKNTRIEKRATGTVRVCRTCAREHIRRARGTPPDRYRDGWDEKMQAGLDLMKAGERAMHAAQAAGVGRAALGRAWKASGGVRRGRQGVMTDQRTELASRLLAEGKALEREVLPAVRAINGPPISRATLYIWAAKWRSNQQPQS